MAQTSELSIARSDTIPGLLNRCPTDLQIPLITAYEELKFELDTALHTPISLDTLQHAINNLLFTSRSPQREEQPIEEYNERKDDLKVQVDFHTTFQRAYSTHADTILGKQIEMSRKIRTVIDQKNKTLHDLSAQHGRSRTTSQEQLDEQREERFVVAVTFDSELDHLYKEQKEEYNSFIAGLASKPPSPLVPPKLPPRPEAAESELSTSIENLNLVSEPSSFAKSNILTSSPAKEDFPVPNPAEAELVSMGFSKQQASAALELANGNMVIA